MVSSEATTKGIILTRGWNLKFAVQSLQMTLLSPSYYKLVIFALFK